MLNVKSTEDFEVSGDGKAAAWKNAQWQPLTKRGGPLPYEAKVKVLYSKTGLYVLYHGTDGKMTATLKDGAHLWTEDVFEVFLQPDAERPAYFEYEISPRAAELSLMVSHAGGKLLRWQPWVFEEGDARRVRKAATVSGGDGSGGINGWRRRGVPPLRAIGSAGRWRTEGR